jgi:hypothetical protein
VINFKVGEDAILADKTYPPGVPWISSTATDENIQRKHIWKTLMGLVDISTGHYEI